MSSSRCLPQLNRDSGFDSLLSARLSRLLQIIAAILDIHHTKRQAYLNDIRNDNPPCPTRNGGWLENRECELMMHGTLNHLQVGLSCRRHTRAVLFMGHLHDIDASEDTSFLSTARQSRRTWSLMLRASVVMNICIAKRLLKPWLPAFTRP